MTVMDAADLTAAQTLKRLIDRDDEVVRRELSKKMRSARRELGQSQAWVAQKLGLTDESYGAYERGEHNINFVQLWRLSKIFGVRMDYWMGDLEATTWNDRLWGTYSEYIDKLSKEYREQAKTYAASLLRLAEDKGDLPEGVWSR